MKLLKKGKIGSSSAYGGRFFLTVMILIAIGLVAVADASAPSALRDFSDKYYFVKQQGQWAILGIVLMIFLSRVNYRLLQKFATPLFFFNLALLVLVLVPGIGSKFLGARRWLILGPVNIQPSEFIKLFLAVYIAKVAVSEKKLLAYIFPIVLSAGIIMLQPDLGTTLVVVGIAMSQLFVSGINLSFFLISLVVGLFSVFLLIITSSYRKDRLLTFLEQTQDPLGKSYHIRQILIALGSGSLLGVGLGQSRQKYLFLPETATDSIFAVIAEEVGFIGAFFIITLFAYLIFTGLKIAGAAPDKFSKILALGIVAWIGGQVILNIGSIVALVPLTGIPLPFISYGGSSMVASLMACGILLNIAKYGTRS